MSKLTSEQWSTFWTRDTITTLSSMFPENYDLSVADFWHQVLAGEPEHVIDLACGNGTLAWLANDFLNRESPAARITGVDAAAIDPFTTLQKDAREFPGVEFIGNTPIEKLPFDDASVDVAISQYGLEYSDLPKSIPEISRVLKPAATMGFIVHNEASTLLKGSTRYLGEHKKVLEDINIHRLFLELDGLIGKGRDLTKVSAKPKVKKKMLAINTASDEIKRMIARLEPQPEIQRYCIPMFNVFSEASVRKSANRKQVIRQSVHSLTDYIGRIEDFKNAALSERDVASLVSLIENQGFTISEHRPIAYKDNDNIGIALLARR